MRKVLVVAYYFPPFGGGGVQRTTKYVKYLPQFGWQPLVLTVQERYADMRDPSLEGDVSPSLPIFRTAALLLPRRFPWRLRNLIGRWLFVVDQQLGWLPFATRGALQLHKRQQLDAVYTTSAPYTAHLIGLQIKKRTGLPWVADFRDPWVDNFAHSFPTALHERGSQRLEQRVVETADRITVVSEPMRRALLARYPALDPSRILTLPNGYDPEDFRGLETLDNGSDRMRIIYSGSFYGQRTPISFLHALQVAIARGNLPADKVQVILVGNTPRDIRERIAELGLGGLVEITGYLPHRESLGYLSGADLLLLIVGSGPNTEAVLTAKVFEYLAAGKPILCLAPPCAAADLVREARAGVVVEPENVNEIATQLACLFQQWEKGELRIASDQQVVARYDRRQLTASLARSLDGLVDAKKSEQREPGDGRG